LGAIAATQNVAIQGITGADFAYVPASASVNAGDTVHWMSSSTVGHTVTRCDNTCTVGPGSGASPATFNSGSLPAGGSFDQLFNSAGTYNYYCTIHGYDVMHGTVTVAAIAAAVPAATPSPTPSSSTARRLPPTGAGPQAPGGSAGFPSAGSVVAGLLLLVAGSAAIAGFFVRRRSR
jgi:plastocyanin